MDRQIIRSVLSLCVALLVGAGGVWAAPGDEVYDTAPSNQQPQGIGQAPGPGAGSTGLLEYRPIPNSMMPQQVQAATPINPNPSVTVPVPTNLGGPSMTTGPYTLGRDDVIHIMVRGQPDFSGTFAIGHDGKIQYGFVGDVQAEGLTKEELRDVLAERLKQFVRVPAVQVTIAGFNSKAVYIVGAVARPGKYSMRGDTVKVRDALIAAGLLADNAALSRVHVIKADKHEPVKRIANLKQVLYNGKLRDNIDLVNGDVIVVPWTIWSRITRFVSGIVNPTVGAAATASAL